MDTKTTKIFLANIAVILGVLFCFSPAHAEMPYREAAAGLLLHLNSPKAIVSVDILEENRLNPQLPKVTIGALASLDGGGYILLSPSTYLTPVKAYSLTRPFEDLPPPVRLYFLKEMEAHARITQVREKTGDRSILEAGENPARWSFLLNIGDMRRPLTYTPDTWLLQTAWHQNYPFNKFTPRLAGLATVTGCANTALAQIMKYYGYPSAGRGTASYQWNGETLKAILFKTYNWQHMPDTLDAATPAWQADQVAGLLSDVGIANHTVYGIAGSSASVNVQALIENFGYSNNISSISNENAETFFSTLTAEIDAERPVLLSLPGHMVVADGYAADGTGRKIHLNMGWGGKADDFYYLDETIEITEYNIDFITNPGDLQIYFPVKPCSGSDCQWASGGGTDVPPVINTVLADRVLQDASTEEKIFIDARDENGDALFLSVTSGYEAAVQARMEGSILVLTPSAVSGGAAGRITVTAEAAGQKTEKFFVVLTTDQSVGFGKAFAMTGRFQDQESVYRHPVILDGSCTISGYRGYGNQAFYTAVLDKNDATFIEVGDIAITDTFTQERYTITASLRKIISPTQYSQYDYEQGVDDGYVLNISCPEADDSIETIAGILGIDLSGLNRLAGDVNEDGSIDLADAITVLKIISRQPLGTSDIFSRADVNHDGALGVADLIYIFQYMAGLRP
ncbi:MAG: C10 family peptidase [Deltaproteobacteria bacterium]|nr:C10 family peptidase [Deltaproteobacteria bacterium]